MSLTEEAELALAIDRLEWAVGADVTDTAAGMRRLGRALAELQWALGFHAASTEAPDGPLSRPADPTLLPFDRPDPQIEALRQEHRDLQRRTIALRGEIGAADGPRPSAGGHCSAAAWAEYCRRAEGILAAVRRHREHECDLTSAN